MIVAAGLTPAWQQILTFAEFHPGEVNRASSVTWCASGKVLNVGSALHHLQHFSERGASAPWLRSRLKIAESGGLRPPLSENRIAPQLKVVSFFGGETGRLMRQEFDSLGVPTSWIESSSSTRVCTTILDQSAGTTTELVENSSPATAAELERFADAFAAEAASADWVILTGSLPQQTPAEFFRRLMESTSARVILDVRGPELKACLPRKPFLVKPNREELAATFGRPLRTDDELLAAMHELRRLGAERVVISHGAGELWLLNDDGLSRFLPPTVQTVNPIGCGDCLAAGMAVAFSEGANDIAAVRFGIAAAAENARQLLPSRLERSRVESLATSISPRRGVGL